MTYTKQETYEKIREHFTQPGVQLARVEDDETSCYYRHPEDAAIRCAIGCLIPDSEYSMAMERRAASDVIRDFPSLGEMFAFEGIDMMDQFQAAHDGAADVPDFLERLDETAQKYGLTVAGTKRHPLTVAYSAATSASTASAAVAEKADKVLVGVA